MDDLYRALVNYYEVLFKTGYMSIYKAKELIVMDFLLELMRDPDYLIITTSHERGTINKLYNLITTNNCLI